MQQANQDKSQLKRNLTSALVVAGNAEQCLIGVLLILPDSVRLAECRRFLKSEQFVTAIWRETYLAILELADNNRPYAPEYLVPLVAQACNMSSDDVGSAQIAALESVGNITTAPEYARSVVRQWQHCELRRTAIDLVGQLQQPQASVEDIIAQLIQNSERIRDGYTDADESPFDLTSTVAAFLAEPDAEVIPTGVGLLDAGIRGGIRRKQFVVVGARPSVGKSALCGQIGIYMAQHRHPVMYLSCEMSNNEMTARWLNQTGLTLDDEMDRELFESTPLKAVESSGWTIDRVEALVNNLTADRAVSGSTGQNDAITADRAVSDIP